MYSLKNIKFIICSTILSAIIIINTRGTLIEGVVTIPCTLNDNKIFILATYLGNTTPDCEIWGTRVIERNKNNPLHANPFGVAFYTESLLPYKYHFDLKTKFEICYQENFYLQCVFFPQDSNFEYSGSLLGILFIPVQFFTQETLSGSINDDEIKEILDGSDKFRYKWVPMQEILEKTNPFYMLDKNNINCLNNLNQKNTDELKKISEKLVTYLKNNSNKLSPHNKDTNDFSDLLIHTPNLNKNCNLKFLNNFKARMVNQLDI